LDGRSHAVSVAFLLQALRMAYTVSFATLVRVTELSTDQVN